MVHETTQPTENEGLFVSNTYVFFLHVFRFLVPSRFILRTLLREHDGTG